MQKKAKSTRHLPAKVRQYSNLVAIALALTIVVSIAYSSGLPQFQVPTLPLANAQNTWNTQTIATGGSFGAIYMALDSTNNPHVVYSGANRLLYYASWTGTKWNIQSVIQGATLNQLILDSHDSPHILYKGSNGVTYIATWNGLNWMFQTVPAGYGFSLALDSKDSPHVAYEEQLPVSEAPKGVTNNVSVLKYASWNGSNWTIQAVDSPMSRSDNIYLALDKRDNPHIMYGYDTYYPPSGGYTLTVKFAVSNGSSWSIQTTLSDLDFFGNMALDSNGGTHFIYAIHYPHESIIHATMGYASWDGTTLQTQIVTSNESLGLFAQANFALDSHNNPHIEFFNGSLMYASLTSANWNIQTVAPNNFAYGAGPLALESNGNPIICYWVDDIRNTTTFVSQLLITSPAHLPTPQEPTPPPNTPPPTSAKADRLWDFKPGYSEIISPTVADGYVYFLSGNSGAIPAALYCLDASTGAQIWKVTGFLDGFTVSNGYAYVGEGLPGAVVCLNAYTGEQTWNYTYGTSFGSLAVANGVVYAGGLNYDVYSGAGNGFIFAFNASNGAAIWIYTGSAQTRFDFSHLTVRGHAVYAVSAFLSEVDSSWNGAVFALDASTGKELWVYRTLIDFNSLLVTDQNIYVSSNFADATNYINKENINGKIYQGEVLALDALNGTKVWEYATGGSIESFNVTNDRVYAISGDGTVYAFDAADGSVVWNYNAGTGLGSLLSVNSYLYVGSSSGVYCFDATNGKVIWNFVASDFADSSTTNPTFSNGIIYLGWNGPMFFSPSTQHSFYAISAWNGQKLWNFTLEYTVSSSPLVAEGIVFVGGNFVSTRNPDFESTAAIIALKSNVVSIPFTPPTAPISTLAPTSTKTPSSTNQTQFALNPFIIALLGLVAIIIGVLVFLSLRRAKKRRNDAALQKIAIRKILKPFTLFEIYMISHDENI